MKNVNLPKLKPGQTVSKFGHNGRTTVTVVSQSKNLLHTMVKADQHQDDENCWQVSTRLLSVTGGRIF